MGPAKLQAEALANPECSTDHPRLTERCGDNLQENHSQAAEPPPPRQPGPHLDGKPQAARVERYQLAARGSLQGLLLPRSRIAP